MKAKYTGSITLEISQKSPYWQAYFVGTNGRRCHKSTKVPHAGGMFEGEKLTAKQAKIRAAVVAQELANESAARHGAASCTISEAAKWHLARKAKNTRLTSYQRSARTIQLFLDWLGERRADGLDTVAVDDVETFIAVKWGACRNGTKKLYFALLAAFFNDCKKNRMIKTSPCAGADLQYDKRSKKITKDIFSEAQLAQLFAEASPLVADAVRICLGIYGQRIGDCVRMRWENIDFERRIICMTSQKTRLQLRLPIQPWFFDWLTERKKISDTDTVLGYGGSSGALSQRVSGELCRLGLAVRVPGRAGQRGYTTRTFHALRATAVTMLHAAGVPETLAMKLVGHSSKLVHEIYCRPTTEQLAEAAAKLPDFG